MSQAPAARSVEPANLSSLFSRRASAAPSKARLDQTESVQERISFVYGFPDPACLPAAQVTEATTTALNTKGEWALQYGNSAGYPGLMDILLEKFRRDQGIDASRENIIITAGGSQALALVLDALVDWGDTVITEAPTWMGAVQGFRNVGANVVSIPVDDHGTDTAALERELRRLKAEGIQPKLIYVISNFQNPSGISTTLERRQELIALAREFKTLILEDDAYFDLRYEGESIPPIYALDDSGSTMYLGTLSKTMGAGMRLGWLLAAPAIIDRLSVLKIDGGTNIFGSYVAAEWVPRHLLEHVDRLRDVYRQRRDLMLDALERHMPPGTTWTRPEGGFFVWVTFPEGIDTTRMLPQAAERGVEYLPGTSCFVDDSGRNALRLSFSFAADDQIDTGIRVIGEIAKGELLESGSR